MNSLPPRFTLLLNAIRCVQVAIRASLALAVLTAIYRLFRRQFLLCARGRAGGPALSAAVTYLPGAGVGT